MGFVFQGLFSGGARIFTVELIQVLKRQYDCSVLCLHDMVLREQTAQPMQLDACYTALRQAGVPVIALKKTLHTTRGTELAQFSAAEQARCQRWAQAMDLIVCLKEQPLALLNSLNITIPMLVCLQRSDPFAEPEALHLLLESIHRGRVQHCIATAYRAQQAYMQQGVSAEQLSVIQNGVDTHRFIPSLTRRHQQRVALGIPVDARVAILASRFDPQMKDIPLFWAAARYYLALHPSHYVVCCGAGMVEHAAMKQLLQQVFRASLPAVRQRMRFLGLVTAMEEVWPLGDIGVLTSRYGEATPLVLHEAAACGLWPIATDVGDTSCMLHGRVRIVPRNPYAMGQVWAQAARLGSFILTADERQAIDVRTAASQYRHIMTKLLYP